MPAGARVHQCMRPSATSVCGLKPLVYAAFRYIRMPAGAREQQRALREVGLVVRLVFLTRVRYSPQFVTVVLPRTTN